MVSNAIQSKQLLNEAYDAPKDKQLGLYEKVAELGNTQAMVECGNVYYNRNPFTEPNDKKAFEYYEKATKLDNPEALCTLADCYLHGVGTKDKSHFSENVKKAVPYYKKAASLGNLDAIITWKDCLRLGRGVKKDLKEAQKWEKAFEDKFNSLYSGYTTSYQTNFREERIKLRQSDWIGRPIPDTNSQKHWTWLENGHSEDRMEEIKKRRESVFKLRNRLSD